MLKYANKSSHGIFNLHKEVSKLKEQSPDLNIEQMVQCLCVNVLNSIKMSSQEEAWMLLKLHMFEKNCALASIPTMICEELT